MINVSNLCFKQKCNFLYVYVRRRMKLYVCVKASVIAIESAKRRKVTKKKKRKEMRRKNVRRHFWCALRHTLMYSDTMYNILRTTRACIENYKRASDQFPVIFYVTSLFLISIYMKVKQLCKLY
ncbi:hypothetical protein DBV15_04560 [Temnothorax longispinosus]|uniref:Uncharacterized protein n=1 Tax=Temnothorax longispinosus TaxID=300112 RepID=A0A4S2KKE9_9HYME|nr:hypothetical protein DBV15_04560 [Temnothorax longispinosus]